MKKLMTIIAVVFLAGACKKENGPLMKAASNEDALRSQSRISVNGNYTKYHIKPEYEQHYSHWCQFWNSPLTSYEKSNACGPTAYMLAAHMIAAAHGYTFMPASATKLNAIIDKIGYLPISITQISSHVKSYDSPPLEATQCFTQDRSYFKAFLQSHLADGNPLIVPVVVSGSSRANDARYTSASSTDNFDMDGSSQSGRPNYVLATKNNGGVGHFVVVIGITVYTPTGQGLVYYKDPLSHNGATRVCSYTRFLESARINGSCTEPNCFGYDALVIEKL